GAMARRSPKPAVATMHTATAARVPIDAARTGPSGARKAMHSTGMVDSRPATPWLMPRSVWTSLSSGPTIRIGTRKTRPATNRPATTVSPSPDGFETPGSTPAPEAARPRPPSATEPRPHSGRRGSDGRGDLFLGAGGGEAIARPVDVDHSDDLRAGVGDGRGDGADAHRVLVTRPGVAITPDLAQAFEQRGGVRQRARRELLEGLGEVARKHRRGQLRKEDLAGRDRVEGDPGASPVPD